jgi:hypothetical protein
MGYPRSAALKGAATIKRQATKFNRLQYPKIARLRREGKSFHQIATTLNDEGHTTMRGKPWKPMQVWRVLMLYPEQE